MLQPGMSPFNVSAVPLLAGRTVLQLVSELGAGGTERSVLEIAAALSAAGARALVACGGGRLVSELQARGGIWLPFPADSKNPIAMAMNAGKLAALMRAERVDVVHAFSRAPAWVALAAIGRTKIPLVTTFRDRYADGSPLNVRYSSVMARGNAVIANSRHAAEFVSRHYPPAVERLRLIHRGLDLRGYSPAAVDPARVRRLRQDWGVQPDERVVLFTSGPGAGKGILSAVAPFQTQPGMPNVRYILLDGSGEQAPSSRKNSRVQAAPGVEAVQVSACADMPAAILAACVVVIASRQSETSSRAAIEAQAMGTPVIVSTPTAPDVVLAPPHVPADLRTGWHVAMGDPKALAKAIGEALSMGAAARDTLAMHARSRVDEVFSLHRMTQETLEAYATLLDAPANE